MLNEQTIEKLSALKLPGMVETLKEQLARPETNELSFEERLAMLVDAEYLFRENKRMKRLLKNAKLKLPASVEDIDFRSPRGLDKSVMPSLGTCGWIRKHQNVIIVGPTGTGKTFLSCALAQRACREGVPFTYAHLRSTGHLPWRKRMEVMHGYLRDSRNRLCLSLTISGLLPSLIRNGETSWRSLKIGTERHRPLSRANCLWNTGMR